MIEMAPTNYLFAVYRNIRTFLTITTGISYSEDLVLVESRFWRKKKRY